MARYNPHEKSASSIYDAAAHWRDKCLLEDGSIFFAGRKLWTKTLLDELDKLFVQQLDMGEGNFFEKLETQLTDGSPQSKQLMAELDWLLLLFASRISPPKKRQDIRKIWSWSGETLTEDHPMLSDSALGGLGHTGTAYNTQRWREFIFAIDALRDFKSMPVEEQRVVLSASANFAKWLMSIPSGANRQLQHILTHLIFPDDFERISTVSHKYEILASFEGVPQKEVRKRGLAQIDQSLKELREKLEKEKGQTIDFYEEGIVERWKTALDDNSPTPDRAVWIEKSLVKGRPDRQDGPHRFGEALWSPQKAKNGGDFYANMRKVAPGDIVLHLTDNAAFTGVSEVAELADDTFVGLPGTNWADEPAYRVQLRNFKELKPSLSRDAFFQDEEIGSGLKSLLASPQGKGLFYNKKLELNQGAYLSEAPPPLITLLNRAYTKSSGRKLIDMPDAQTPDTPSSKTSRNPGHLNTIYYGPPGTGKTYETARRAVLICDGNAPSKRDEVMQRYEELYRERRIEFVTFHQSYSYEEFIEGLRPETGNDNDAPSEVHSAGFRLVARPGVLKRIAERARQRPAKASQPNDYSERRIFKISLGRAWDPEDEEIRTEAYEQGLISLGYGGMIDWSNPTYGNYSAVYERWREEPGQEQVTGKNPNIEMINQLRNNMRVGDIVIASQGNKRVRAVGIVTGDYRFDAEARHPHRRDVEWRWQADDDNGIEVDDIYTSNFSQQSVYQLTSKKINWDNLLAYLEPAASDAPHPSHVLIIDEINRANISKVLGELITLLEEDKRAGALNELAVTLPYSGDRFTLPANLHIVGTMNTADRSIALLDTALRRRFRFEELPPRPEILSNHVVEGIGLDSVLETINTRLEWYLGSDHLIGHGYFTAVENLEQLDEVIATKVITLLKEYFHEDLSRVRGILGGGNAFLRRTKISAPPGMDDAYEEERYRYIDRFHEQHRSYGRAAYDELLGITSTNTDQA